MFDNQEQDQESTQPVITLPSDIDTKEIELNPLLN